MSHLIFTILAIFLFGRATADLVYQDGVANLPGNCPQGVTFVEYNQLDFQRLSGTWYLQYTTFNLSSLYGCTEGCFTLVITPETASVTRISACCQVNGNPKCGENLGSGVFTHATDDYYTLHYQTGENDYPGYLITVDYNNQWCGFFCTPGATADDPPTIMMYCYTRNPVAPAGYLELVQNTMTANNMDPGTLQSVAESSACSYSAGPSVLGPNH